MDQVTGLTLGRSISMYNTFIERPIRRKCVLMNYIVITLYASEPSADDALQNKNFWIEIVAC